MPPRKIRTREHIIADLSINHFELSALKAGFAVERTEMDYGYDAILSTYDINGEIENGFVLVQLKATDHIRIINNGNDVSFTLEKRDLNLWLKEFNPVYLVVYDSQNNNGHWLYIQNYFENLVGFNLANVNVTINVNIPIRNRINKRTMLRIARNKNDIYNQVPVNLHS